MKASTSERGEPISAPLWWWVGLRMSALAVGAVLAIAAGMWLYFQLDDERLLRKMPVAERQEFEQLRLHPKQNEARLWQLIQKQGPANRFLPGLANPDWIALLVMVATTVPVLVLLGLWTARPLSRQFTRVADAARHVSHGDFATRVGVTKAAPQELTELANNFNDMTMRLQQYEREVRASSAVLAHELRTPLNAAMGRVQGMLDGVFPLEAAQLQAVHRQLDEINRLISDLYLVSLARAGQLVLEREEFSLRELLAERLEWAAPRLQQAGMVLLWPEATALTVHADRGRTGQLLSILIDNVLRYAADGKVLEMTARRVGAMVEICVSDRGAGVPEDQLPTMLDRFWRAERSRARDCGGSGLGLAIAAAICQAHGGDLACRNRQGGGLAVTACLPTAFAAGTRGSS